MDRTLVFIIRIVFILSMKSHAHLLVSLETYCLLTNTIYDTLHAVSEIECARYCYTNRYGQCGRFVWDPVAGDCMLHSSTTSSGTSPSDIQMQIGWKAYTLLNGRCIEAGYVFDPESNTCLRVYVTSGHTWADARAVCKGDGGDLISITTNIKWNFVANYVCKGNFWIGLMSNVWMTGEIFNNIFGVNVQLNNYDSQYPSDAESSCVRFSPTSSLQLTDLSCNIRQKPRFICEIILS